MPPKLPPLAHCPKHPHLRLLPPLARPSDSEPPPPAPAAARTLPPPAAQEEPERALVERKEAA
jgi:hypothetical protein